MRNVLVHAHIFKNAGTTFDFSLGRHFGEGFTDHREDERFLRDKNAFLLEYLHSHSAVNALSSHSLHFRIVGDESIRVFPVYFLRHPLARVWSVYQFEKKQTGVDTEGARRAKEMDLNGYVRWYLEEGSPATIRNIHTIFLSGDGPSPHDMDGKFQLACNYMAQEDASFCIVERYNDSMLMLEDTLSGEFPGLDLSYTRKNVGPQSRAGNPGQSVDSLLGSLEAEVGEALVRANEYDLALYERAEGILDRRLSGSSDPEFRQEAFSERCRQLQAGVR